MKTLRKISTAIFNDCGFIFHKGGVFVYCACCRNICLSGLAGYRKRSLRSGHTVFTSGIAARLIGADGMGNSHCGLHEAGWGGTVGVIDCSPGKIKSALSPQ